jgi:hypothetical protein
MSPEAIPKFFKISPATLLTLTAAAAVTPGVVGCFLNVDTYRRQQSKRQFEQEQQAITNHAGGLAAAGDYLGCLTEVSKVRPQSNAYYEAQSYWRNCQNRLAASQLEQAKRQAEKGEFAQAIQTASQVSSSSSCYDEAQQLIKQWSERILEIAETYYLQPSNQCNQALTIARAIPASSPIYSKAQEQLQKWQQLCTDNTRHWFNAQQALNQGQLDTALNEAQQIVAHPFWALQRDRLLQTVQTIQLQQQYEAAWKRSDSFLEQGELKNAITTANQLPDTVPWGERKQRLIGRAEAKQRQIALCQAVSLKLLNCH